MKQPVFIISFALLASLAGGVFVLRQEKTVDIADEKIAESPEIILELPNEPSPDADALIREAQGLVSTTQAFLEQEKQKKLLIDGAREKSARVRGIYAGSAYNRNYFENLLDEAGLNGIVIDVKESYGINLPPSLKSFILKLHEKDVWTIGRIAVFRDSSLIKERPEWYLASTTSLWRDKSGQYWLDPQNEEVRQYIIDFSKRVVDLGFDELQFDYIRYPDDYLATSTDKQKIIGDFFSRISESLKNYKPDVILSVDLFGYVATQFNSSGTGQRLVDAGKNFDYLSPMLYPSHFYAGFWTDGIKYPYPEAVEHPYDIVYYSILTARNYLSSFGSQAKIRPWLQDFNLAADSERGVVYDAEKVRAQIDASLNTSSAGWLLWNPSYVYTLDALR